VHLSSFKSVVNPATLLNLLVSSLFFFFEGERGSFSNFDVPFASKSYLLQFPFKQNLASRVIPLLPPSPTFLFLPFFSPMPPSEWTL